MPGTVAWAGFIGGGEGTRGRRRIAKLRNWQPLARRRHDRSPRRSLTPTAGAVSCPAAVGRDAVDFGGLAVGGRGTDGGPAPAQVSRSDLRVLVRAPPPGTDSPRRRLGPRNRRESCPNDAREAYAEVGVRGTPSPPSSNHDPSHPPSAGVVSCRDRPLRPRSTTASSPWSAVDAPRLSTVTEMLPPFHAVDLGHPPISGEPGTPPPGGVEREPAPRPRLRGGLVGGGEGFSLTLGI